MNEEHVFKALADVHRRKILDLLFAEDGQSLQDISAHFEMTRYGVMKHLQVLEDAGLITTQKVGREKHHYLNPVPIQLVYDRWVSKYARPWSRSLAGLKYQLEGNTMSKPQHVQAVFIRTTPEKLWDALTNGSITTQYYMGTQVESTWEEGAEYVYKYPNGEVMLKGVVKEADPPRKLVTTFVPTWNDVPEAVGERVIYEIEPMGDVCKLTLTHTDLDPTVHQGIVMGWSQILSGLKTLLETGEALVIKPETATEA